MTTTLSMHDAGPSRVTAFQNSAIGSGGFAASCNIGEAKW
jgi:hypothetical protein